jgi:hypothetical protein
MRIMEYSLGRLVEHVDKSQSLKTYVLEVSVPQSFHDLLLRMLGVSAETV